MSKSIVIALSAATLLAAPAVHAADLAYSGRYEHGLPEDRTGDADEDWATVPEDVGPRHRDGRREVEVIVRNTIVSTPVPAYGWGGYAAYPNPCACRSGGPSGAYAAGYAYGYALGTFAYGDVAGYGPYGW